MFSYDQESRAFSTNAMRSVTLQDQMAEDLTPEIGLFDRLNITIQAAGYGLANNAIELGKWTGIADETATTYDVGAELDSQGGTLGDAYRASRWGYDLAGALTSSLVPGLGAMKAINLAKAGKLGTTSMKMFGGFEAAAKKSADEIATAYNTVGSTANVAKARSAVWKYTVMQQAVEGAFIGAVTEASLNLGSLLNDEGLSSFEKMLKFGTSVAIGAGAQGAIGGAFVGRSMIGQTNAIKSSVFNEQEFPLTYRSLSASIGNRPSGIPVGHKLALVLSEYDRIAAFPVKNEVQKAAQNANLSKASEEMNIVLNELFPKKASGAGSLADEIEPMRKLLVGRLATPDGRKEVAGIVANLHKLEALRTSAWSDNGHLNSLITKLGVVSVPRSTLKAEGVADDVMFHTKSVVDPATGKNVTTTYLDDAADLSLVEKQELIADYALRRAFATPAGKNTILQDIEAVRVARGIGAGDPEFDVLKQAYKLRSELGAAEFNKVYKTLGSYFSSTADDILEAVYNPKAVAYLDANTGAITSAPVKHLGDLNGVAHNEANGVVGWTDASNVNHAVSTADLKNLGGEVDLLRYQAGRLLAGSKTREQDLLKVQGSIHNYGAYTAKDFYALEKAIAGRTPLPSKAGQPSVYVVAGARINSDEAVNAIAEFKAKEIQRLLAASPDRSMDDVLNSVGASRAFGETRGSVGTVYDVTGTAHTITKDDIITDAAKLRDRRSYAMTYSQAGMIDEQNGDIYAAIESFRAEQYAKLKDTANAVVSDDLSLILGDSLGIEDVTGFGAQRFISNAAQLGGYQGMIATAARAGDWILQKSDELFTSKIAPDLKAAAEGVVNSATAKAEYAALSEWYYRQAEKFIRVDDSLYVAESSVEDVVRALKAGTDKANALKNLLPNSAYVEIEDTAVQAYIKTLQKLNAEHVVSKRTAIEAAYGNSVNIISDALYLPPRDYKHMTFIVEKSTSPLDPKSNKVYRVVAETKEQLEEQVRDALADARAKGLNWVQQTSADVNAYKTAKMQWEWDGEVIKTSRANSSLQRTGQAPALVPEADAGALIVKDAEWLKRQVVAVHRAAVEMHFADDISRLNTLIWQHDAAQVTNLNPIDGVKVKFGTGVAVKHKPSDFEQVLSLALGADSAGASHWRTFNNTLEEWSAKTLTATAGVFHKLRFDRTKKESVQAWIEEGEAVEKALRDKGIGLPMGNYVADRLARETTIDPADIRKYASMTNMVQSTLLLRLDYADSVVNLLGAIVKVGGEVRYLKDIALKGTPEIQNAFRAEWVRLFGAGTATTEAGNLGMWSTAKAMSESYARYFTKEGRDDVARWVAQGLMVDSKKVIRDSFEEMRLDTSIVKTSAQLNSHMAKVAKAGGKMIDFLGAPSAASGMMAQYAALHMAESLGTAAGLKGADLAKFMWSFNRRTNAVTNPVQKPRLFQGVAGISMSLYQSYMFHMMRNMFRYADTGSKASIASVAALNGTFFGAQSIPGFDFMNNAIASRTEGRTDLYGAISTAAGAKLNERDLSDFMLYGAGAWLLQGNLYTRGGLTPRTPTLVPTHPSDLPVANAAMKIIGSVTETAQKLAYGAPVATTIAEGFVNMGLNRPLMGVMDIARGKAVDANYSTIMYHDDIWDIATDAVRISGLKPLNQAITSSYQQRLLSYKAIDAKRKTALGEEIRTLYSANPDALSDPDVVNKWVKKYTKAGGQIGNFDGFLSDQLLKAKDDLGQRLEKVVDSNQAALSQYRSILGN